VARPLKLTAQGLALAAVAGLLALLVWKVAHQERDTAAARISKGLTGSAPGFDLQRLDRDGKLSLRSLRGKAVVINFWASWCIPCKREAPTLEQAWRTYGKNGLVVLGVDWNDASGEARRFARKHDLSYPLVRDRDGSVGGDYGLTAVPETFFVDRHGRLVGEHVIGGVHLAGNKERFERGIALALES
jgi:cytochrome c biogenesis protein CcmG/thiol:disulfide interchange protein DsbE